MNYILIVVVLAICAGAYYDHTQEEQKVSALQAEVDDAHKAAITAAAAAQNSSAPVVSGPSPATPRSPTASDSSGLTHDLNSPPLTLPGSSGPGAPVHHAVVVDSAEATHAGAVDAAAAAAEAAANGTDLGTVTTLDNRTFTNCKVVKVEEDGVTFSTDAGIAKIEYPLLPPDLQKKFGYTPQAAVVRTEAEIRANDQQQAATPQAAPASP